MSKQLHLLTFLSALLLGLNMFCPSTPLLLAASDPAFPAASVVLLPDISVAHTDDGLKLLDAAAFIDVTNRLQVPLRFIAEELGADVEYSAPKITVTRNGRMVILELGQNQALVDGETRSLDAAPLLHSDRVFVPLRFLSESLGLPIQYRDGVIVVGSWFAEVTAEEAAAWQQGIISRWVKVEPDWETQEIIVSERKKETESYSYFWRYLGNDLYALYQSSRANPGMAILITADLKYNDSDYRSEGVINCDAFFIYPDACYAILHIGSDTRGIDMLYRFSSDSGTVMLTQARLNTSIIVHNEYVYFTHAEAFGPNTTYRVHIPTVVAGKLAELQRIGQKNMFYGYKITVYEDGGRSGGCSGFCIGGDYLYANGFKTEDGYPKQEDMAFYRVDLQTMEHEKLLEKVILLPKVCGDWICFWEGSSIFRMRYDGSEMEKVLTGVEDYYCDGDDIVYYREWTEDWQPIWQRYTMTD